ncbi:DUF1127 domain-containing protein [Siculibacillus lacustris]|nr:DUF1127 domain-containing protein [Siculibacillus lacustris]
MSFSPRLALTALVPAVAATTKRVIAAGQAMWRIRRHRREVHELLNYDARALADIGLTQGDLMAALSLPALSDPSRRLVVLAVERRAGRRAQIREQLAARIAGPAPASPLPGRLDAVCRSTAGG